jgi:hypothetical protein
MSKVETILKLIIASMLSMAILIITLRLTLGEENFLMVMWWLILAVAGIGGLALIGAVIWLISRGVRRLMLDGAMVAVEAIGRTVIADADKSQSYGRFGAELLKTIRPSLQQAGSDIPPMLMHGNPGNMWDANVIDTNFVATGFDEESDNV